MKVVITGATGNVGTGLVEALADDERVTEIVGIARRRPSWSPPKTRFVSADVETDPLESLMAGAQVVVHLAWLMQPTHRPVETWRTNVLGSLRVFEAAASAGVGAIVYASSIGAYSAAPPDGRPVNESWPTHSLPTAAYGREKAYVERILDTFEHRHPHIRVVRLRPAFIFQRASATEQRRLMMGPLVPRSLLKPGRVPILPYPTDLRMQTLHTTDVVEGYRLAVISDARGAFNLAAEPVLGGPDLAEIMGARPVALPRAVVRAGLAAAWRARLVPADPHLLDLLLQLPEMDTTRARHELGWSPRRSASDTVAEWLRGTSEGAGGPTPPLAPDRPDRRLADAVGIGQRQ
jgi:UDP-glucose 4-epimerase